MQSDELVSVMVPRRFLAQVYGFIASLETGDAAVGPTSKGNAEAEARDMEWTPARLQRMVRESSPALLAILGALADNPGEWLTMNDLAKPIGPKADWNTVAGTLGAFGRRLKSRYGLENFPFENRLDHSKGTRECRMSKETARLVKKLIAEG